MRSVLLTKPGLPYDGTPFPWPRGEPMVSPAGFFFAMRPCAWGAGGGQERRPNLEKVFRKKCASRPGRQAAGAAPERLCHRLAIVRSGSAPGPPKICSEDFYELGLGV